MVNGCIEVQHLWSYTSNNRSYQTNLILNEGVTNLLFLCNSCSCRKLVTSLKFCCYLCYKRCRINYYINIRYVIIFTANVVMLISLTNKSNCYSCYIFDITSYQQQSLESCWITSDGIRRSWLKDFMMEIKQDYLMKHI